MEHSRASSIAPLSSFFLEHGRLLLSEHRRALMKSATMHLRQHGQHPMGARPRFFYSTHHSRLEHNPTSLVVVVGSDTCSLDSWFSMKTTPRTRGNPRHGRRRTTTGVHIGAHRTKSKGCEVGAAPFPGEGYAVQVLREGHAKDLRSGRAWENPAVVRRRELRSGARARSPMDGARGQVVVGDEGAL